MSFIIKLTDMARGSQAGDERTGSCHIRTENCLIRKTEWSIGGSCEHGNEPWHPIKVGNLSTT